MTGDASMKETKSVPAGAKPSGSSIAKRGRLPPALILGGALVVVAGAASAVFAYRESSQKKSEVLVYHLCIGTDQKLCPDDLTFVRYEGDDTATKWAQRQCTGYKARRIIINDGPTKDCGCSLADLTCSSE
jgi:hypothetical protein